MQSPPEKPADDVRADIEVGDRVVNFQSRGVLRYSYFTTLVSIIGVLVAIVTFVWVPTWPEKKGPGATDPAGPPTTVSTTSSVPGPASTRLVDLEPVAPHPSIEVVSAPSLSGQLLPDSIAFSLNNERRLTAEYNLARQFATFQGVMGVDDRSNSAATVSFEVLADNHTILAETSRVGKPIEFSLDVTGVLRLQIRVSSIGSDVCCVEAVVGTPRLRPVHG